MSIPEMPNEQTMALLTRFREALRCWQLKPDTGSERNDNGRLVYDSSWLELHPPMRPYDENDLIAVDAVIYRYRVPTELVGEIIWAKSLEKALEEYIP